MFTDKMWSYISGSKTEDSDKEISMSTLGRNMEVGMLYDCCTDRPILGEFPWSREELKVAELSEPSTSLVFIMEDEANDTKKVNYFEADASLQASILSGLVTLGGAAKYLNDSTKMSNLRRRVVTLHYEITTKQTKISITDLTSPNVRNPNATHVVTSVTYGVTVFLVFYEESAITKDSHKNNLSLKANLKVAIAEGIGNEASVESAKNERANLADRQFGCTLYGDFTSELHPSNYKQALKFCRELPKLCETNPVSVRVTVTPLSFFQGKHTSVFKEIDHNLLSEFVNNMSELERMSEKCQTLMQHTACEQFPSYSKLIHKYYQQIVWFTETFKKSVARILPEIRRSGDDKTLQDVVTSKSPFTYDLLNCWINCREKELRDLEGLLENLPGIKVIETLEEFKYAINDPEKENVVCFALPPILSTAETYLNTLKSYRKNPCHVDHNSQDNTDHVDHNLIDNTDHVDHLQDNNDQVDNESLDSTDHVDHNLQDNNDQVDNESLDSTDQVYYDSNDNTDHDVDSLLQGNTDQVDNNFQDKGFGWFALDFKRNAFGFYNENRGVQNNKTSFVVTSFKHKDVETHKNGSVLLFSGGKCKTEHFTPPGGPVILNYGAKGEYFKFSLSWENAEPSEYKIKGYKVTYTSTSSNEGETKEEQYGEEFTTKTRHTIYGLSRNTTYEFQVFTVYPAWTSMGSEKLLYSTKSNLVCTVM
ncbi:stonustoxin subunit beta-like [Asterias rubens]|uniref:stonustoxin subunit beta-like n=1 Tax=Asterias rubens TaxID=7604 RepID=UPI00145597CC|nr:stonustoxin subunit beta-like [Asterias rubens]